ncbi:MAG: ATP-binding protein [Kiritimatiellaeota bacterium]|nr:ATP-binding protein [Kiritimatiellota bacterium]
MKKIKHMKNLTTLAVAVIVTASCFGETTNSLDKTKAAAPQIKKPVVGEWTQEYEAAKELAKEKNLPMFLNFTGSDWCGWCMLMDRQVFSTQDWKKYAKENLVLVTIDFPQNKALVPAKYVDRNKALQTAHKVSGYPTYVVLAADGTKTLGRLGASREATPQTFIASVDALLKPGRIAALSEQIDMILHGRDVLDIDVFHEGELSVLQSEIQKMTVRLREQADALARDKTYLADSLADIAHQLRTPMTSLHMLCSFLAKPNLDTQQRTEFSHELESLLNRMDWLLSTLLKISKIDAGTAVFQKDATPVHILLRKAVQPLEIPLELRGIALHVRCESSISITGDLNWTAEALGNILKNCMEHTDHDGTIEIDCVQNAVYTEIAVKDSGAGIAPEDLPHIFERFYQGKQLKDGSFGVGLALSRMILSAQNATIKATNRPEGGACFTVRFYYQNI